MSFDWISYYTRINTCSMLSPTTLTTWYELHNHLPGLGLVREGPALLLDVCPGMSCQWLQDLWGIEADLPDRLILIWWGSISPIFSPHNLLSNPCTKFFVFSLFVHLLHLHPHLPLHGPQHHGWQWQHDNLYLIKIWSGLDLIAQRLKGKYHF